MVKCAEKINEKYGCGTVNLDIRHQYYNMKQMVEPHLHIVDKAMEAMKMEGIEPKVQPIRGGTDGANLSYMGLPCPNIFAGGHNFHGKFEYIPLESMEKASKVVLNIISLYAK
jgi:tripeptide aminopeptidase